MTWRTHGARGQRRRPGRQMTPGRPIGSGRPIVVILAHTGDRLAELVSELLVSDDIPVLNLEPEKLAENRLRLHRGVATIEGQVVRGLLLRAATCLEADDEQQVIGRLCGDPTLAATWLAAASLASVRAINSYDAEAWRRGAGRSVWVSRLGDCGVPVFCSRDRHPSPAESTTSLVVCGEIIEGPNTAAVTTAAGVLRACGVQLATVSTLPDGTVSDVDTQPRFDSVWAARRAARRVTEFLVAA